MRELGGELLQGWPCMVKAEGAGILVVPRSAGREKGLVRSGGVGEWEEGKGKGGARCWWRVTVGT